MIDHGNYTHNLSSCEIKAWKKTSWTGFEPMTSSIPVQAWLCVELRWSIKNSYLSLQFKYMYMIHSLNKAFIWIKPAILFFNKLNYWLTSYCPNFVFNNNLSSFPFVKKQLLTSSKFPVRINSGNSVCWELVPLISSRRTPEIIHEFIHVEENYRIYTLCVDSCTTIQKLTFSRFFDNKTLSIWYSSVENYFETFQWRPKSWLKGSFLGIWITQSKHPRHFVIWTRRPREDY